MATLLGVKLRNSCESCAASKVRCSKNKPVCNRCSDRGTECHYLVTQRFSKKIRLRDAQNDHEEGGSSAMTIMPMPPTAPTMGNLSTAAGLPYFGSSFGGVDNASDTSTNVDDSMVSLSTMSSASLSANPRQELLRNRNVHVECPQTHKSFSSANLAQDHTEINRQRREQFTDTFPDVGIDTGMFDPTSSACPFWTSQSPEQSGNGQSPSSTQQSDSLKTALQLMSQLSCVERSPLFVTLTAFGYDYQTDQLPQLQVVIEKNRKVMENVSTTLQSPCHKDGYFLVVICLIISKVLSTYGEVMHGTYALANHHRRANASSSVNSLDRGVFTAPQRVLDELYLVKSSMDQLGIKLRLWEQDQQRLGQEATPKDKEKMFGVFPFSAAVLNQLYSELQDRLSSLSLEMIDELKRYWT